MREGFHIDMKAYEWDYQSGSLFHLVLSLQHLPSPNSITPDPCYGWRINDRFVVGWRFPLRCKFTFRFQKVARQAFVKDAEQFRLDIKRKAVCESPNAEGLKQITYNG